MPRLPKQRLITGAAPAVSVAGGYCFAEAFGYALAISLCLHNHAPQLLPTYLTLEQQAANQLWCHHLGRAAEKLWGKGSGGLEGGRGYGGGLR